MDRYPYLGTFYYLTNVYLRRIGTLHFYLHVHKNTITQTPINYLPLFVQDPKPAPQAAKEKKKKKVERVKAVGEGLEGFVDWGEPTASEPAKEKEDDMST